MHLTPEVRKRLEERPLRLTICTREHTQGNVYNYAYWKCGNCGYHPGGSDGPPAEHCLNCKARLYTDDASEAALLIRIVPWKSGLHFEIVEDLRALRQRKTELAAVLALPEAIGGSAQGWQPPDDSDDGNFTIGGEPWTDAQLEQLRAAALSLDLKSARRLLEKHGYTVYEVT